MKHIDWKFRCTKCNHTVYIDKETFHTGEKSLPQDCPSCGEEQDEWKPLWGFIGDGNYGVEYGQAENSGKENQD